MAPAVVGDGALPLVNHYVIGVPTRLSPVRQLSVLAPSASAASAVDTPDRAVESLCVASMRGGLAIIETKTAGDCGIDAMAYFANVPRTASSFKTLRLSLAAFIESVAGKAEWQCIFRER